MDGLLLPQLPQCLIYHKDMFYGMLEKIIKDDLLVTFYVLVDVIMCAKRSRASGDE